MLPLFHDHHHHPAFYAALADAIDLAGVTGKAEALRRLAVEREGVAVALGWNDAYYDLTPADLAALPPVLVCNLSLHGFRAGAVARRTLAARDAEAVERLDDPGFVERQLPRLFALVTDAAGVTADKLERFFDRLRGLGVGSAEEMFLPGRSALAAYRDAGLLDRTPLWCGPEAFATLARDEADRIRGIKFFADGALGATSAALERSYRTTGGTGFLLHDDATLARDLNRAFEWGKAAALHALGDRALAQAARVAERLAADGALPPLRIEHAQFIDRATAGRFKRLGVALSMQPNFSDDSLHYRDRLPAGYAERNNPFRMLIDEAGFVPGEDLVFGSDGMPSGAAAALRSGLEPPCAGQRLTRDELAAGTARK